MKIALASDHAGYPIKQHLVEYLRTKGHDVADLGVDSPANSVDYPDWAELVAHAVKEGRAERGILVCGSGVGICIAANKFPGIYAAITHDTYSAAQGVEHDHMNVMCLGARVIGPAVAETLADTFLAAQPSQEARFLRRLHKVQKFEAGE